MEERVKDFSITDNDTGKKYTFDFSRETVKFAESRGFELENLAKFPATNIPDFFYYALRMHHKDVARANSDALLEKMGGLSEDVLERLIKLYQQAQTANVVQTNEDAAKNAKVTLEL